MTIVEKIEAAKFVASVEQIEALAHEQYGAVSQSKRGDGTYLKALVTATQSKVGRRLKPTTEQQLKALESVHVDFYIAVVRGVTTPDIAHLPNLSQEETTRRRLLRERRAVFARSAKSTLAAFVKSGGNVRDIDVATVTKSSLRAAVQRPVPEDKVDRQIFRSQGALVRAVSRRARGDPAAARDAIEHAITELQAMLDKIPTAAHARPAAPASSDRLLNLQRHAQGGAGLSS
jgi:hypothetical protein